MVALKFEKIKKQETGYMLLESLLTLIVIATILVMFFPMITDWFMLRNNEKYNVEQNRLLYEQSMNWPTELVNETRIARNISYQIKSNADEIKVTSQHNEVGVIIYEVDFE